MRYDDNNIYKVLDDDAKAGFRLIVEEYKQPLYWHLRRLLVSHDDTDDALQETFVRAWRKLSDFKRESSLRSWLFRIATNEALRVIEQKKRQPLEMLTQEHIGQQNSYIDYDDEMLTNFQCAIQQLPEKQRVVFNLRYYDEMDYDEIAEVAGMTENSAKVNFSIAKNKVKDFMTKNINIIG